jgi:hypothetical protein
MVVAETAEEAENIATGYGIQYEVADSGESRSAIAEWMDSIPYGDSGDRTVREWLEEARAR